jgi:hypothetical protein
MPTRILIAGAIANHPLYGAGNTWAFLQYVLGFRQLGIETYYVEELNPEDCIDESWNGTDFTSSANARYFHALMDRFALAGRVGLLESNGPGHIGLSRQEIESIAPSVDLLINVSGRLHMKSILAAARRRMYLDLDPGYTQIWQEGYGIDMNLRDHNVYVTVGLNLVAADCPLPSCGIHWEKTLPPVAIDEWATSEAPGRAYSTIADWRSFGAIEWRGVWYKQKADAFKKIIDLPRRVEAPMEICLAIDPAEPDRLALEHEGWHLTSPAVHAATLDAYHRYITGSRGEFTAVKEGYATGRTGWFSDRSACYLAAGRPVVLQATGFEKYLPTGLGLLTFTDRDTAAAAIEAVEGDYARHARAAAAFAREFLDARTVLPRLLELSGI